MKKNKRQVVIAGLLSDTHPEVIKDKVLELYLINYLMNNPRKDILWIEGNIAKTKDSYICALYGDTLELVNKAE